jgi:[ribosomal protein S18]-alanine N-acetyltransferase
MTQDIRIWRGDASDSKLMARLHAPVFPDPWPEEAFRSVMVREPVIGLLGARGEEVEGFILIHAVAGEAEVLTFCVSKDAQRSGMGGALLAAAYDAARQHGASEMFLEVSEKNEAALALYRRDGFVAVGRRAAYYQHSQPADALVMRKILKQP